MKYLSLNSKLNFPDFSITLDQCSQICEYYKSKICYAKNNPRITIYNRKKYMNNENLLNSKNFVNVLKKEILLSNFRKIRFFSSGDIYKLEHLEKIEQLAKELPLIKFWLSTYNDNILYQSFKDRKNDIKNLNIILSNKMPNSEIPEFLKNWCLSRNIMTSQTTNKRSKSNCHASKDGTSCGSCENCFNGMNIVYFLHGKHVKKRLKEYEK